MRKGQIINFILILVKLWVMNHGLYYVYVFMKTHFTCISHAFLIIF
jgi:hypothetical protein